MIRSKSMAGAQRFAKPDEGIDTSKGFFFTIRTNTHGTNINDNNVTNTVPPTMAVAKGGQNKPPPSNRGRKPATVVIVVEVICRVQCRMASTIPS